jgi:hypothetical protein
MAHIIYVVSNGKTVGGYKLDMMRMEAVVA